jgi:photosystem II stability/assembly factor-like uncharacterized protein
VSPSACVVVGGDLKGGSESGSGTILRSTDRGGTWRNQPSATTNNLYGVGCASPATCLAVGGGTIAVGYGGTSLRSTDGDRTWRCTSRIDGLYDGGARCGVGVGRDLNPGQARTLPVDRLLHGRVHMQGR